MFNESLGHMQQLYTDLNFPWLLPETDAAFEFAGRPDIAFTQIQVRKQDDEGGKSGECPPWDRWFVLVL